MPRQIETPTSRSGSPSLIVDGVSYHSPYDPIRESSRFFNSLNLEGADIIFQFGWGLGYGSEALRTRCKPSVRILVLEPDDELLDLSRNCFRDDPAWQDPRFQFVSGSQVCRFFSHNPPLACQETDNILPKETFLIAEQGVHFTANQAAARRVLLGPGLFEGCPASVLQSTDGRNGSSSAGSSARD
jgi:hypothetical protein